MNKQWINNIDVQQKEKWSANSGVTVYATNLERYLFNKTNNRSTIVIGTGKETKFSAQGNIIIHHSNSNQLRKLKDVLLVP